MENEEVVQLYLDDIIPNRFQPREVFNDQALKELAISIREHGVIQPIIVRKFGEKYEIIAGERRYKASTMAGLTKIPAIVKNLDDKESSKVALIENLQRRDLTPIEEARTYQKILDLDQMTQENLAKTMGKSQSAVSNKLRLLSLPDEVQEALLKDEISERHARSLLNVNDKNMQVELLKEIINNKMTVRELDNKIRQLTGSTTDDSSTGDTAGGTSISPITEEVTNQEIVVNSNQVQPTENLFNTPSESNNMVPDSSTIPGNNEVSSLGGENMNNNSLENNINSDSGSLFSMGDGIPEASNDLFGQSNLVDDPTKVDIDKIKEQSVGINPPVEEKPTIDPRELVKPSNNYADDSANRFIPNFEETTIEKTEDGNEVIGNGLLAGMPVIKPVTNSVDNANDSPDSASNSLFGPTPVVEPTSNDTTVENNLSSINDNSNVNNNDNLVQNSVAQSLFDTPANNDLQSTPSVTPVSKNIEPIVNDIDNILNNYKNQGYNISVDKADNESDVQLIIKINKN